MTTKRGQAWSDQLKRLAVCVGDLEQCDDLWLLLTAAGLDEHSLEQARSGVERVLAHLPSLKEHRVVDLGCGVGRHLFWFDALSDAMLVGIDTSRPLVECARALVPEANIVQSDIAGIGERGAFQLVCSFAHSFFLSDSLQDFSSNLRAIRGAMHDFGLLWLEQSEVQPGELRWQAAGLVITQATEEVSPAVLSHRFTVGDAKEITTYSVKVTSDEMAELAENAGFLLEFVDRVLDDGEWITCFALRAQKGYNFLSDMSDFLASWASPDHWRNDVDVVWDDTESGRRKPVGEFALQQGASLSRHHPDFRSAIELGVLRLVLELVEGWDFVTYSSCEGHLIETVPVEVFSEAYCGIVTFANRQITVIEHMVERAVRNIELEHVRVRVRRRNLYGPTTSHSAIDIVFERGTPGTDWARYRTDADLAVGKLVDIFSTMRKGECG